MADLNPARHHLLSHSLLLILFWAVVFIRYLLLENLNPAGMYYPVYCPLDDMIPFCEIFLIPYVFWYFFMMGMHLYTILYDQMSFRQYTKFLIFCFGISTVIFLIFPSCQNLRPTVLPRDNILIRAVRLLYRTDTNTNVFPSEHVIGAIAVFVAAMHTQSLRTPWKLAIIGLTSLFICLSTLFLKQHSVLDTVAAVLICILAYLVCYRSQDHRLSRWLAQAL